MDFRIGPDVAGRPEWRRLIDEESGRLADSPDFPPGSVGEWTLGKLASGREEIRLTVSAPDFGAQLHYSVKADGTALVLFARIRTGKGVLGDAPRAPDAGSPDLPH